MSIERRDLPALSRVFPGESEMARRMRAFDWLRTPLGPPEDWPENLKISVRIMLSSRHPMFVWWGEQLINLYNDGHAEFLCDKHPAALGQPASTVWPEIWHQVGPRVEYAMTREEGTYDEALPFVMLRKGYTEETYVTFSYSPIRDAQGAFGGILCPVTDETDRIIGERQLTLLRELAARTADTGTLQDACSEAADALAADPQDLPFALIYVIDGEKESATLAGISGLPHGSRAAPESIELHGDSPWPLEEVVRTGRASLVPDVSTLFDQVSCVRGYRIDQSVALPIAAAEGNGPAGVLVVGLSPLRLFDATYQGFLEQVTGEIAAALARNAAKETLGSIKGQLELRVRERTSELQEANLALRESQRALAAEVDALKRIQQLSTQLIEANSTEALCETILDATMQLLEADFASLQELTLERRNQPELKLIGFRGFTPEAASFWEWVTAGSGTACGMALSTGKRCVIPDVEQCDFVVGTEDLATYRQTGIRAVQTTPLISLSGTVLGALSTHWHDVHELTDREIGVLDILARLVADLIERSETEEALRESARVKDEFIATVSHELRTPLCAILGWARLLESGSVPRAQRDSALRTIVGSAQLLSQIVEDLLDFSRMVSRDIQLEFVPVKVHQVVRGAIRSVSSSAAAKKIKIETTRCSCVVSGDERRLQQILINLLSNAIKFSPKNTRVCVKTEAAGGSLLISVSDSGEGIAPEVLPHVFERFTQADSSATRDHSGLGLGLAIVKHLVELHGGTVVAESPGEGQGATFTVRLPLLEPAARRTKPQVTRRRAIKKTEPVGASRPLRGIRILAVDDEESIRDLLKTLLERSGAETRVAESVAQAMRSLEPPPDLLIGDLAMPGEDGYALIRKIRLWDAERGSSGIPAIALTAYGREEDHARALAAGYQQQIVKPIDPHDLVMNIAGLFGRAEGSSLKVRKAKYDKSRLPGSASSSSTSPAKPSPATRLADHSDTVSGRE